MKLTNEGLRDTAAWKGAGVVLPEYDRAEMARFTDCVIGEAKELGIETLPPEELERMLDEWQKNYGAS